MWLSQSKGTALERSPPKFRDWAALLAGARFPSSIKSSLSPPLAVGPVQTWRYPRHEGTHGVKEAETAREHSSAHTPLVRDRWLCAFLRPPTAVARTQASMPAPHKSDQSDS